jgi:hypothetical protein
MAVGETADRVCPDRERPMIRRAVFTVLASKDPLDFSGGKRSALLERFPDDIR